MYEGTYLNPRNIPKADGLVLAGWRHANIIAQHAALKNVTLPAGAIQGFLTSEGNFVDREEAMIIATAADQLVRDTYGSYTLYSEDIY